MASYEGTHTFTWHNEFGGYLSAHLRATLNVEVSEDFTEVRCTVTDLTTDVQPGEAADGGGFVNIAGIAWGGTGTMTEHSTTAAGDSFEAAWAQLDESFAPVSENIVWAIAVRDSDGDYAERRYAMERTYRVSGIEELESGIVLLNSCIRFYNQETGNAQCNPGSSLEVEFAPGTFDIVYFPWAVRGASWLSCNRSGGLVQRRGEGSWVDRRNSMLTDDPRTVEHWSGGWVKSLLIGDDA